mmetsp:Transcript_14882/g.21045  ORF Transcript_14882/g.21045 Transcript_14882/m.21045 type:complete len:110 (+) Transcript_14882:107-436(+)
MRVGAPALTHRFGLWYGSAYLNKSRCDVMSANHQEHCIESGLLCKSTVSHGGVLRHVGARLSRLRELSASLRLIWYVYPCFCPSVSFCELLMRNVCLYVVDLGPLQSAL